MERRDRQALSYRQYGKPIKAIDYLTSSDTYWYWSHTELDSKVFIPAGTVSSLRELKEVLASYLPDNSVCREQMLSLDPKQWSVRMGKHFHGKSLALHGWSWVDSDEEEEIFMKALKEKSKENGKEISPEVQEFSPKV